MKGSLVVLSICAVLIGGCTAGGSGPILISKQVEQGFEKYKQLQNPSHFAVSENGRYYGYSYCSDSKCLQGGQSIALYSCKRFAGSIPCKIFARGTTIVWEGPVEYENQ